MRNDTINEEDTKTEECTRYELKCVVVRYECSFSRDAEKLTLRDSVHEFDQSNRVKA